jgi:ribose transport system substrate-binding protein
VGRRWLLLGAILVALAAGCGGDDDEEAGAPAGTDTAATETTAEASGVVAEAQKLIDAAREPLEFEPPGPPIDVSEAQGKRILVLSVDQRVPTLAQAAGVMQEAGRAAGVTVTIFDARSDVARMQQGLDQAVRQADAAILLGIPIALVGPGLAKAKAANVPTVSVLNNEPEAGAPGQGAGDENVFATTAPSYFKGGQLVAAKAIVDTEGEAKVVIFNTSEITPAAPTVEGMKDMLERCDTCEIVDENDTPLAEWSTALTGKAVSAIRQNPDVNFLLPIFDGMGIFVHAGILQANATDRVKVAAFNGTPAALDLILQGDAFTGDPGQPNGWLGWHAVDQALRGILGEEPGDPEIPIRFFDDSNLEGVDVNDLDEPYGNPDYRAGFQELWGVSG